MKTAIVIGAGPAGLMAADELSRAGAQVTVIDGKPSLGRKFLMAGKSGLNLTKDEPLAAFTEHYGKAASWLSPMLEAFGPNHVKQFADALAQDVFTGTSGRVFPKAMKASPMLRAWIAKLVEQGVTFQTKSRWLDWDEAELVFDTPSGIQTLHADAAVFALGGASWARLGSDGAWATAFARQDIPLSPFEGSNSGIALEWSAHMTPFFGFPLKAVEFRSGTHSSRGEAVISKHGLEGGGIYSVSAGVRSGQRLYIDLRPDWTLEHVQASLEKSRGKASLSNHMRRVLNLKKHELALLNEFARPLPSAARALAKIVKNLPVDTAKLRPLDEAISTNGGVTQSALDENLMLYTKPGVFCAGEMLDWEAPTGGYLLSACFTTGRKAGRGAARYLGLTPTPS